MDQPTSTNRVIRGGCWNSNPRNCRPATRSSADPSTQSDQIGFRVAWFPRDLWSIKDGSEIIASVDRFGALYLRANAGIEVLVTQEAMNELATNPEVSILWVVAKDTGRGREYKLIFYRYAGLYTIAISGEIRETAQHEFDVSATTLFAVKNENAGPAMKVEDNGDLYVHYLSRTRR